ncbi:hypothetical protein SP15_227 [Bacillus phage SP-15]|uniref:Uncharacterized protein n=1 Tax=Bacillus phage SP-15 TaxID=1792032 RepID=A0A127AWF6_9CAUD|nr:hypothetical protein SP15_227 [Bacillus phage SP-15]AMM45029.1 hypothetical protein SP15_227 [Bacillus phage SP-15]
MSREDYLIMRKREVLRLLERDCVSPTSRQVIEDYINKLHNRINELESKKNGSNENASL